MFNLVFEWLDYGKFNGLGCWHNSGKGRFSYEVIEGERPSDTTAADKPKRGRKKKTTDAE
jgi:hypothetical protein